MPTEAHDGFDWFKVKTNYLSVIGFANAENMMVFFDSVEKNKILPIV